MGIVPEVMITPKTLNSWLTEGYGVDTFGYNRIVVLDVDDTEGYLKGHIPGAYLLEESSVDLWATRSNGITDISYQVATQLQMDAIIRITNIDNDSIIILTGSRMTGIGRAYFNFRYWGFPRQQLKVLNGTNATYTEAGFLLQKEVPPVPEPCRFSVCSTTGLSSFSIVRASFEEMIAVAADNDSETIIIDSRSPEKYAGKPGSTLNDRTGNSYVAFEGHIRTAANIEYKTVLADQSIGNPLLPQDDLEKVLNKNNLNKNMKYFVYGTNAFDDSVLFLALDAVLNWPVKLYDGGWQQWGQMAGNTAVKGGMLDEDSVWRTDNAARSESITYNKSDGFVVETGGVYNSYAQNGDAISRHDLQVCGKLATDLKTAPLAPGY